MYMRLVSRVEDERITRRIEHPVQRDGELHHPKVRPQVSAVRRYRGDQALPDLRRQGDQVTRRKVLQIPRTTERIKECHTTTLLVAPEYGQAIGGGNILPFVERTVSILLLSATERDHPDPSRTEFGVICRAVVSRDRPDGPIRSYPALPAKLIRSIDKNGLRCSNPSRTHVVRPA